MRSVAGLLLVVFGAGPLGAQLTLRVTSAVPAGASVYVAGTFNGWNPSATPLARDSSGAWRVTLPATVRGAVELKFTLGSWSRVETAAGGGDVPNRSVAIGAGAETLAVSVAAWRDSAARRPSTASRSVSVLSDTFAMPELGRTRRVTVYLPPGYATSARRYPVLYMHDGQNVFDAATSFGGEWGVDETLDSLHAAGATAAIVVAIDNAAAHRLNEYNPWKAARATLGGGEGDAYVNFLVGTLKPYVDSRYRTLRDPSNTAVMGSSMGGLISLYAALKHPDVFGRAGVFSCACWVARPAVYEFARGATAGARLYFVAGELETKDGEPARDQREMVDTLVAAGWRRGVNVQSVIVADGEHTEAFWRREFASAHVWLFPEHKSASLDVTVGLGTSWGGDYHDRAAVHAEATFVDHVGDYMGGLTIGARATPSSGDKCVLNATLTGCVPRFPALVHIGVLVGLERVISAFTFRAMAGPAAYGGRGRPGAGAQLHLDAAAGFSHLAAVIAARGSAVRRGGETLGLGSLEFGLRLR